MTSSDTADLGKKLDIVIRLLAAQLTAGKTKSDAILQLAELGFAPREIASIVQVTPNRVSVTLYKSRRGTVPPAGPEVAGEMTDVE